MPAGGNWKELLRASGDGDLALMKYHLEMDVDPNYQHPEFFTAPIFEAIRDGQTEAVKVLLQFGADLNLIEDHSDMTPLEVAVESRQHEVVDILCEHLPQQKVVQRIVIGGTKRQDLVFHLAKLGHCVLWSSSTDEDRKLVITNSGNSKVHGIALDLTKEDEVIQRELETLKPTVWVHDSPNVDEEVRKVCKAMPEGSRVLWLLPGGTSPAFAIDEMNQTSQDRKGSQIKMHAVMNSNRSIVSRWLSGGTTHCDVVAWAALSTELQSMDGEVLKLPDETTLQSFRI